MKNKKIIILIIIIMIAPLLIVASALTGRFSSATRNAMSVIGVAIYTFAIIYSIWFIRSKKNK
jgi:ABC-type cobalt transport system substrate-binding protein